MNTGAVYDKNDRNTFPSGRGEWPLLVVVDDGVHHVHHGLGGTEHWFDGVEPGVALIEVVGHLMPATVVFLTQIVEILPVAREA